MKPLPDLQHLRTALQCYDDECVEVMYDFMAARTEADVYAAEHRLEWCAALVREAFYAATADRNNRQQAFSADLTWLRSIADRVGSQEVNA